MYMYIYIYTYLYIQTCHIYAYAFIHCYIFIHLHLSMAIHFYVIDSSNLCEAPRGCSDICGLTIWMFLFVYSNTCCFVMFVRRCRWFRKIIFSGPEHSGCSFSSICISSSEKLRQGSDIPDELFRALSFPSQVCKFEIEHSVCICLPTYARTHNNITHQS